MQINPTSLKKASPALRLLDALAHNLPTDQRLILNGFVGDPQDPPPGAFRNRPWRPGQPIPFGPTANGYVTTSSFGRATDGSWRRRAECFRAAHAFMVDDVGPKVPRVIVERLPPSAIVETSPGNFQYWYFLQEPELDREKFDGMIRAFIAGPLGGVDPGMSAVTRVGRLPGFTNGKKQHNGWVCRLLEFNERRFTVDQLVRAFGLRIAPPRPRLRVPREIADSRIDAWVADKRFLKSGGMLKRERANPSGWIEMTCPWVGEHTGGANSGAALREPAAENDWHGAFHCSHGHCSGRGLRELRDWMNDQIAEELAERNRNALATLEEALRKNTPPKTSGVKVESHACRR
jgi:hypothetical protein